MADTLRTRPPGRWWLWAALPLTPLLRWAVLAYSVPPGVPPAGLPWRAGDRAPTCPHCEAPVGPGLPEAEGRDRPNLPGPVRRRRLGLLAPAGRCYRCDRRAGAPPYLLEVAAVAAAALVAVAIAGGRWSATAAMALCGWAAVVTALTFIDLAVHRLPDRFTLPAAGWVLGWLGLAALTAGDGAAWVRAAAAAGVCGAGFALVTLVLGSRGFGLGDAKLALSAGALLGWLGWTAVVAGLLLAFLGSGLVAAVLLALRRVSRRDSLPFGPFLAAGALCAAAWAGVSG